MASKLLKLTAYKAKNELELSLKQAFEELEPKLRPLFPLTIPTPQEYSKLNLAILYGVLTESHLAKTHIKHLHSIVTDGYALFVSLIVKIVNDLYGKFVDSVKDQLIWVVKEMVDVLGVGFDGLLVSLLRQIVGGDFSDRNLWLCFELSALFSSKWDCLVEEAPFVLTSALFVYLRVLADHCKVSSDAKIESLKRLEIEFCVKMLREQFHLCMKIGRDLIRLLRDLVHVPEFRAIWKDLVLSPREFGMEGFSDVSQLYCSRTSSLYFLLRITPEMETQLRFLLMHVKFGNQKRYQMWFARKFLFGQERETLVIDIVRFICCAHHPSNETIQSDIIPRWAVIGWLLKSCREKYVEANVKLALFYDWLFFDEKIDNIMNIEPAMLLMVCSIPKYVDITHSLLEFLLFLAENYDVDRNYVIIRGLSSAMRALVRRGVVPFMEQGSQVPGLMKIRYIGQTTIGSAAIFGLFLGAGSLIHCGTSYFYVAKCIVVEKRKKVEGHGIGGGGAITALKKVAYLLKDLQDESVLIWFSGKEEKHLRLSHVSRIISGQHTVSSCYETIVVYLATLP
ncbi:unnamed protein product [Dovyalis caffra]|uniref:Integrator complex subunit 3 N-terminal domain-containing protein n=1 Tax=Dovyalis caffra TaxID=77055 RepID=A0AAV1R8I1_9ROSI|nr:unnamed protein product [Dovyalis caffra]